MLQTLLASMGQGERFILIFVILCVVYAGIRRIINKKKNHNK